MRNKLANLVIIAISSSLLATSCKKGEEDPAISFRSRESRLTGTWVLKEFSGSYSVQNAEYVGYPRNDDHLKTYKTDFNFEYTNNRLTCKEKIEESGLNYITTIEGIFTLEHHYSMTIEDNGKLSYSSKSENGRIESNQTSVPERKCVLSGFCVNNTFLNTLSILEADVQFYTSVFDTTFTQDFNTTKETSRDDYWKWVNDSRKEIVELANVEYIVERLSNKELILKQLNTNASSVSRNSTNNLINVRFVFEKEK